MQGGGEYKVTVMDSGEGWSACSVLSDVLNRSKSQYERLGFSGASIHTYRNLSLNAEGAIKLLKQKLEMGQDISTIQLAVDRVSNNVNTLTAFVGKQVTSKMRVYQY